MANALQTAGGLALVIALILGAAWLLRGMQGLGLKPPGLLRVVASQHLGARERVVVVELAGTWLVLGVAPGRVAHLASMPRADAAQAAAPEDSTGNSTASSNSAPTPGTPPFQAWLQRALQRK